MNIEDTRRLEAAVAKLKKAQEDFQKEIDSLFGTGHESTDKYGVIRLRRVAYASAAHGQDDRKGIVIANFLGCRIRNEKSNKSARVDWSSITAILD